MTDVTGLILLAVFLAFAAFMFLERISALLALPLMALAFLAVALVGDLLGPAEIRTVQTTETRDAFGRKTVAFAEQSGPGRFALWRTVRAEQADLLCAKAELFAAIVAELDESLQAASVDWTALSAQLAQAYAREQDFDRAALDRVQSLPNFFHKPPHHSGTHARFAEALGSIAISGQLLALVEILDEPQPSTNLARARELLAAVRSASAASLRANPPAPPPEAFDFRLASAATYVLGYVVLVLRAGSLQLAAAIIASLFGGMFATYVKNLKVAERMVYWTAEFAGERPFIIALAVFFTTAAIFTSVGGLGTVIMLGTIILPILRSVGVGPIVGAGIFLIAIAMGGTLQPVARRLWMDFYGVDANRLNSILWTMVGLYTACGVAWSWWGTRARLLSSFHSAPAPRPAADTSVPARLMVAPLVPVVLVYFAGIEEITAFTAALLYMYLCVCRRSGAARVLARALIEGAQAVVPPVLLMIGIGLLVVALSTEPVQAYLRPLLAAVVPGTRTGYIALFALAAPLALYRGPLNVWGMGLAVSATLLATSTLPPTAVLGAILAAGALQGVCDPTNTANVWIAGFQGVTVNQILRYTLGPVWILAAVAIVVFGVRYVGG